jgi:hypothetical protein
MKPAGIIGIVLIVIGIIAWRMAELRTPSAKRCWISAPFRRLLKAEDHAFPPIWA